MSRIIPIIKRELKAYFTSPIAYAVTAVFLLIVGYFFYSIFSYFSQFSLQAIRSRYPMMNLNVNEAVLRPLFHNISVFMLFMIPMLTMRLIAEEKKSGTIELLMTYPVRDFDAVMGKYIACMTVFLLMLLLSGVCPILTIIIAKPEIGPILSGYLGLILMGGAFIALGLLASSLTENQIIAVAISFGALLLFWVIGWSEQFAESTLGAVLNHISVLNHFENFAKGVIDTKDVIFYLNFIIFFLFLSIRSLETKRWKG